MSTSRLIGLLGFALPSCVMSATLFHTLSFTTSKTDYSFALNASGGWTVGSAAGPAATDADFQSVLGNLTDFRAGASGTAAPGTNGNATNAFALFNPNLAEVVSDPDFLSGPGFCNGWTDTGNLPGGCSSASVNAFSSVFALTLVEFIAPAKYRGNDSAAFNGNLTFGWLVAPNPPGSYDFNSGIVTLTGSSACVPEPASIGFFLAGMAAILAGRQRGLSKVGSSSPP